MKKRFAAALCAIFMLLTVCALADGVEISVQGSASVTAMPDMVSLSASTSITGSSVADAQTKMGLVIGDVIARLTALGVDRADIVTQNYSFFPVYNYDISPCVVIGYQASHSLSVTCRDVNMLDSVINAITDAGMNEIYSISYDISDRESLYRQALALALKDAQSRAETLCKAAGKDTLSLEHVYENSYSYGAVYSAREMEDVISANGFDTNISSGTVCVTASVTADFEAE